MSDGRVKLEICIDSIESAINAVNGGASRLETCGPLGVGGTSPTLGLIYQIDKFINDNKRNVVQRIMIRPRAGDFIYTISEQDLILQELVILFENMRDGQLNSVEGFVFGGTTKDRKLDEEICINIFNLKKEWEIKLNKKIKWTFHRAFDVLLKMDTTKNLDKLIKYEIDTILTSGRSPNVTLGFADLQILVPLGASRGISIMCGGGVIPSNIKSIVNLSPKGSVEVWVHSSGSKKKTTLMILSNDVAGDESFNSWTECDAETVQQLISSAKQ